ncbi:MAG: HAMP domain-containing histidine kinase [Myxococcales bacterium]|nr:HAMP domain-containing histidine kinase [Myxococcales bacterium]
MSEESADITRLQEELRHVREQMFHMAKLAEMGKLVAVVVHELSQPLLGIKAFAQIIRRKFPDDAFIEPKARMIEQQATHMETILDTLRQYSAVENHEQARVDPALPVRAAAEIFSERARKLKIRLQIEGASRLPSVRVTRGHLQQVMSNLLSNAIDAMEGMGGLVVVRLEALGQQVRIRVGDSGAGIPAGVRERIFDSFFTTKKDKGTGLGLSICRDILRQHGGEIRLLGDDEAGQLAPGIRTAFEVLLPAADGD